MVILDLLRLRMPVRRTQTRLALVIAVLSFFLSSSLWAQTDNSRSIGFAVPSGAFSFPIAAGGVSTPIFVEDEAPETVKVAVKAFAEDVQKVTGKKPEVFSSIFLRRPKRVIFVGVIGHSQILDWIRGQGKLSTAAIEGKWESAITTVLPHPAPGVEQALVIAASDRRGAAYALFELSRQMGVSPWNWWADVPVAHHDAVYFTQTQVVQKEPSIQYRGIFLNDEDWGLRPWAAKKMDPELNNIGPHAYERIFELILRLKGNSLWPAMHPNTLAFNAVPENAKLADKWGIVMGASHSEALLRNNVGEWDRKKDGPWNYQTNRKNIDAYWEKRVVENGRFENFYTVGMRGQHDSGLEATGDVHVKARLVEDAMNTQRELLGKYVNKDLGKVPQVIWLYKESLELYRAGMKVPDDVTLGWTDDNYGYIRQLPTVDEQKRAGGSGVYYHVSYWGFPHDHLWLCTTPPSLMKEELTKAYDHHARKYWILNVGDIKPAEIDIDYFFQLAWNVPEMAQISQSSFLRNWFSEQFPLPQAEAMAALSQQYYQLNFIRKPEFMGFNGYNDAIKRTDFNPLAWGNQNLLRQEAWSRLSQESQQIAASLPTQYSDAFFELVGYPVMASAAQNEKLLANDLTYLAAHNKDDKMRETQASKVKAAYEQIQALTAKYNSLNGGKWDGMMSAAPRNREVFKLPRTATAEDATLPLPSSWGEGNARTETAASAAGYLEKNGAVSINAAHFADKSDGVLAQWNVLDDLGVSGASVVYGQPGFLSNGPAKEIKNEDIPWLEYRFETSTEEEATLTLQLLPTFPVDPQHQLRYLVSVDKRAPIELDASGSGEWKENSAPTWEKNVLSNASAMHVPLGRIAPGKHTLRLYYRDPGVVFEHLVLSFPGAPPAYPVPPETKK